MTIDQFDALLEYQQGCCAACGGTLPVNTKFVHIDHLHGTGIVRGILCHNCNLMIGLANDDPNRLRQAARYIELKAPPAYIMGWE